MKPPQPVPYVLSYRFERSVCMNSIGLEAMGGIQSISNRWPLVAAIHHSHNEIQVDVNDNEEEEEEEEDRLSSLPDDILLDILERLPLHSAVRTSTLSRRWRRLPLLLSRLDIDVAEFRRRSFARGVRGWMASYAEATQRLLAPSSERAVRLLRLAFFLCADESCLRSIARAVANSKPAAADLTLWTEARPRSGCCVDEHAALHGRRLASFLAACPGAFGCLTGLTLRSLKLADPEVRDVLSTCARLRELRLECCGQPTAAAAERLVLRVDAPSSRLATLRIVGCFFSGVELVCVPRLAQLVVETWMGDDDPPLRFGHVPRLRHIRFASALLSYQEPFVLISDWLANTTGVSVLDLDFKGEMVWIQPEDARFLAPMFRNLKELHLQEIFPGCDLKWTLLYLEAAPSLSSFYLKISRHICGLNMLQCVAEKANLLCEVRDFKHGSLNYVEIQGFQHEQALISYTRLVMGRAANLKRIRLRCKDECERCDRVRERAGAPVRSAWSEEEKNLVRAQIVHGFSSSSVELIMDDVDLVCADNWFLVEI